MSLRLIKAAAQSEKADELHLARILFLLGEADKRAGKTIQGVTKLAKLDFLLRYPNSLERMLHFLKKSTESADIKDYERTSIESKMVRFRYGPWDDRYRRWIGLLVARGLATTFLQGRTVHIALTESGKQLVTAFSDDESFADLKNRSILIFRAVGSMSGSALKNLVYHVFPEIVTMKWGQHIQL